MKLSKINLLVACATSTFVAGAAQAQVAIPPVELRGAGASGVAEIAPRTLNCVGNPGNHVAGSPGNNLNPLGTNSGTLSTIAPGKYAPTTALPAYDCATQEIQPNFEGKYISTGSGAGRQMWRNFTTSNLNGSPSNINPFAGGSGQPSGWANLHFAFSEAPASVSDITAYNAAANNATNKAGPAIQVPFFVVPVSFAYNPVYGEKTTATGVKQMRFNVKVAGTMNGKVAGGLRLSRGTYCKIFNGEITNWNDPAFAAANNGWDLFDRANDTATRWAAEGAPIRLIGRADRSGTSSIFTRALAAQCDGFVAVNKFDQESESLPYDNTGAIDIRPLRSDTRYYPGSSTSGNNFAGTVQSLGGLVWDRNNHVFCAWNEVNPGTSRCDAALAPAGFTNTPTPGLFTVADGNTGVADSINSTANNAMIASTTPGIKLNGKFGYVGADFVYPAPGRVLYSAALQSGNDPSSTAYKMPSATNGIAAFGTVLPPEATAVTGAWAPYVDPATGDQRQLGSVDPMLPINPATNPATPVTRANALHWSAVIYNPNVPVTQTLASPAAGYPVTGSAFFFTYTCFKPTNAAVPGYNPARFGITTYMGLMLGSVVKNSTGTAVSNQTFRGPSDANLGIIAESNLGGMPVSWANAITQTYLRKSTQPGNSTTLGAQNLWIQDGLTATATQVDQVNHAGDRQSNPVCSATAGA